MFRPVRRDYVVKTLMLLSRSLVLCFFALGNSCYSPLPSIIFLVSLALLKLFCLLFFSFPLSPILELCRPLLEGLWLLVPAFIYLSLMAT